jgi:hypothetical protein
MKDSLRTAVLLTALAALPMGGCIIINESGSGSSGSSGSSWSQERATVTRTASAADAKSVAVENRNGRVTITRDESVKELTVTAEIQCAGRTDEEAKQRADATTLEVTRDDAGLVRVRVKFAPVPDGVNGWGNDAANLDVKAPNLAGIEVVSSNGAIQVEGGFGGATRLRTSNGAIEGIGIGAPAQLETSNGSVDVQLTAGRGTSRSALRTAA